MHPEVQKLLELQRVDQKLASVRRDIDSLPAEEARRRAKIEKLSAVRDQAKAALQHTEVRCRTLETSITGADQQIEKQNVRLNTVRNNAEYQATLYQIEGIKQERDKMQEECLALMDNLDGLRAAYDEAQKALTEEQSVLEDFLKEAEALRAERAGDVEAVEKERAKYAEDVTPDLLSEYERLFQVRGGMAVAAVEGTVCQGCYTSITMNAVNQLMGSSAVVHCNSCQRILYLAR